MRKHWTQPREHRVNERLVTQGPARGWVLITFRSTSCALPPVSDPLSILRIRSGGIAISISPAVEARLHVRCLRISGLFRCVSLQLRLFPVKRHQELTPWRHLQLTGSGASRDISVVRSVVAPPTLLRVPSPIRPFATGHDAHGHGQTRTAAYESDGPARLQRS
jgi:hypothetical protein